MEMRDESAVAKERRAVTMMKTETEPKVGSGSKGRAVLPEMEVHVLNRSLGAFHLPGSCLVQSLRPLESAT